MRPALLLLPVALLAVGAVPVGLLSRRLPAAARVLAAIATIAALLALLALWVPTRSPLDLDLRELGAGLRLTVRLDAVSFAFSLFVLVPAALLNSFLRLPSPGRALLATAASLLAIASAGLILATFSFALAVLALALMLQGAEGGLRAGSRMRAEAAVLGLLWAGTILYSVAGTDQFAFVPTAALHAPVLALVLAAVLVLAGSVPWRPWTVNFHDRFPPGTAALAAAIMPTAAFSILVRMYEAGGGHLPNHWFNIGLGIFGVLVALASTLRAQAATNLRLQLAEGVPAAAGFALLGLALGSPLGVAAAIGSLGAGSLLVTLPALAPGSGRLIVLLVGLLAGLPPTLVFASRIVIIEAAVSTDELFAYAALVGALAWILGLAAAARGLRLPSTGQGSKVGAVVVALLLAAGGVLLGGFQTTVGNPAAATVMAMGPSGASAILGGWLGTDTAAGTWPAVALGLPVLTVLVLLALAGRSSLALSIRDSGALPGPIVEPVWRALPELVGRVADSFEVPDEFRFTGWENVDRAMARATVWFWVAGFGVLAVLLLR